MRTLVLGGGRSGKSAYAERLAAAATAVRYVATAVPDPDDDDFAERIARHRDRRPTTWATVDAAEQLPALLRADTAGATLVDDIGTWLTSRIDAHDGWDRPHGDVGPDTDALVEAVAATTGRLILVSPEAGLGVLPATRSGRLFRDELGSLNQRLATVCDEVFLVVAGLALRMK